MRKNKRILAFLLAVCCLLTMSMGTFAAETNTVRVEFHGNDGNFVFTSDGMSTNGFMEQLPVGSTVAAAGYKIQDPVFWESSRAFLGWKVGRYVEVTGSDGNTWTEFEQLPGTGLLTTAQAMNYTIPNEDIGFYAQWDGDDDDYYSHVYIQGYGAEFKFTEYYWQDDQKITREVSTFGWGNRLRENNVSIKDQVADRCELLIEPVRGDADFEGWLKFKVEEKTADDGSTYEQKTLADRTVYTTAQMLAQKVSEYDVLYAAKWSDIAIDEYFYEAPEHHVIFDGNGGIFDAVLRENTLKNIEQYDGNFKEGKALESWQFSVTDPVFWVKERSFLGWQPGKNEEIKEDDGSTHREFVPLANTGLLTTAQALAFVMPDHEVIFKAQWDGNDGDYYSNIYVNGYMAGVVFERSQMQNGQEIWVEETHQVHGQWLKEAESGESFKEQISSYMRFKAEPVRNDATFEGWAEFKVIQEEKGQRYELVSDTLYTSEQMMNRLIPEYDVMYVAKWSDIRLENYFKGSSNSQVEIAVSANGGQMKLDALNNDNQMTEFTAQSWKYGMNAGMSMSDLIAEGICSEYKSVEKEGAVHAGWTLYECEGFDWHTIPKGDELNIGDPDIEIFYFDSYTDENKNEWDQYIILLYPRIIDSGMTSKELYQFAGSKCYFALANWKTEAVAGESFGKKPVYRISGKDRYQTSYAAADVLKEQLGIDKYASVIVADGKNFPDALAGSYLAGKMNAPILMSKKADASALRAYIEQNVGKGGTIYVLGGEGAVPDSALEDLEGYQICRLSGKTRYETNMKILEEAEVASVEEILVCTGKSFADSLSASATGKPILLVANELKAEQIAFLEAHTGSKFYIIGGEGAVSGTIEKQLKEYGEVERISGKTRYETSILVAKEFFESSETAVVAYAKNFPDGLCGGPLAMSKNAPLILTATGKETAAAEYMQSEQIGLGAILGGEKLITNEDAKDIFGVDEVSLW